VKENTHFAIMFTAGWFLAVSGYLAAAQTVSVTVSLEKDVVTQHEPMLVDIAVENRSPYPIQFDPGYDHDRIHLKMVDPDGRVSEDHQVAVREGMRFSQATVVAPGHSYLSSILLNDWFRFEKLGRYEIDLSVPSATSLASGPLSAVKSTLFVTLLPRDQFELQKACENLLTRVEDPRSSSSAIVAAKALSVIEDPVSIPFLAKAMKRREFMGLMIAALARAGTPEALRFLADASRSDDTETRNMARSALASLGSKAQSK
jgi:hypothetical protein